jgi:HEAT repeats
MRCLIAVLFAFLIPQGPDAFPPLGIIDFYGIRTVPEARVLQALPYHVGDTIPIEQFKSQKHALEGKLATLPGVAGAYLTLVCCETREGTHDRISILYVGIEEANTPCQKFEPAPTGNVRLKEDVLTAGTDYEVAFQKSILKGDYPEDDSQGYALDHDPEVRAIQLRFVGFADTYLANLKDVLHNSSDSHQRAIAAQLLGYVKDKQAIVPDLVAAMRDPDPDVRNNASRALVVFAEFSPKPPEHKIMVPAEPFIGMLNSCTWSDRNKSAAALAQLTEKRDPTLSSELRKGALLPLIEMAQWKSDHSRYSLLILGRIGELSDEEIQKDLDQGNRASVVAAAQAVAKRRN